jgi:hypothetical protein
MEGRPSLIPRPLPRNRVQRRGRRSSAIHPLDLHWRSERHCQCFLENAENRDSTLLIDNTIVPSNSSSAHSTTATRPRSSTNPGLNSVEIRRNDLNGLVDQTQDRLCLPLPLPVSGHFADQRCQIELDRGQRLPSSSWISRATLFLSSSRIPSNLVVSARNWLKE